MNVKCFFLAAYITSSIDLFWNNHKMPKWVLSRTKSLKCRLCFIGNDMKKYIWRSCIRFIPCESHFIRNSSLCMTDRQQSIALMLFSCQNNLNQINSLICVLSKIFTQYHKLDCYTLSTYFVKSNLISLTWRIENTKCYQTM